jgi:hypothetical protein
MSNPENSMNRRILSQLLLGLALSPALGGCAIERGTNAPLHPANYSVDGRVMGVDEVPPEQSLAQTVRITITTDDKPVVVELAPGWVLDERGLHFGREDRVEVQGKLREDGSVLAHQVRSRNAQTVLRTDDGSPTWKSP